MFEWFTKAKSAFSFVSDIAWSFAGYVGGALPPLEDVSLVKLEKSLADIDKLFPKNLQLQGYAFDRTSNDCLGLYPEDTDFSVFAPAPILRTEPPRLKVVRPSTTRYLSTSQQAFVKTIEEGLKRQDTDSFLIDLATLDVHKAFFLDQCDDGSVIGRLAAAVNAVPEGKRLVIRFLTASVNTKQAGINKVEQEFHKIFWPEVKSGDSKTSMPIITRPNTELYVGFYSPDFKPEGDDLQEVTAFLNRVVKSDLVKEEVARPIIASFLGDLKLDKLVQSTMGGKMLQQLNSMEAMTWNHGKIVAVNGTALMTGGINWFAEYASTGRHNICDHSVKLRGNATISAHEWADYFWRYLADPSPTDKISFALYFPLSEPIRSQWDIAKRVEDSKGKFTKDTKGKYQVLSVARLGDWYGGMRKIRYPVQALDAVRDMILNLAWVQFNITVPMDKNAIAFMELEETLSDDNLIKRGFFQDLGVNPMAWASRYARNQAIQWANHSVVLDQQALVQGLAAHSGSGTFEDFVKEANVHIGSLDKDRHPVPGRKQWDGFVWPFDTLIALARAIGNMSRSKTPYPNKGDKQFHKDSKGVFIVLSTNKQGGKSGGWEDKTTVGLLRKQLRLIMQILPTRRGGIEADQIDNALDSFLHIKRTGNTEPDGELEDLYNHSKVVVVDGKVMYIGSDNAYPSYNEEHGVWVDDQPTIDGWLGGFFDPFWRMCKDPDHGDLNGK